MQTDGETDLTLDDIKQMAKGMGHELQVTEPHEAADYVVPSIARGEFWILPESRDVDAKVRGRVQSILERKPPPLP